MNSPRPYQVVAVLVFLLSVALLFVYVRGRVGEWLALAGVLPILFLGPSWSDLLFPYQIGFFGSMACGLAALLCLDRQTRSWDIAATVLLCAGLLFSDAGIPFVAGVAVEVGLGRDRLQRAYIVAVPAVLWIMVSRLGAHRQTFVSLSNAANLPSYVLDGLSNSLASWLGLNNMMVAGVDTGPLEWGRALLVVAAAIIAVRWYRLGRPTNRTLGTLAVMLGFWCVTGLNASILVGLPTATRYVYIGVVLFWFCSRPRWSGTPAFRFGPPPPWSRWRLRQRWRTSRCCAMPSPTWPRSRSRSGAGWPHWSSHAIVWIPRPWRWIHRTRTSITSGSWTPAPISRRSTHMAPPPTRRPSSRRHRRSLGWPRTRSPARRCGFAWSRGRSPAISGV